MFSLQFIKRIQLHAAAFVAAAIICLMVPFLALAQAFPLPEDADPAQLLLQLATNWKARGVLGVIATLNLLSALAVKAWVPESWKWKRLTVLGIAIVYSAIGAAVAPEGS